MTNKPKQKKFCKHKIFIAPIKLNSKSMTITLPVAAARYLEINNKQIFWTAVGETIQISANYPSVTIPVMTMGLNSFTSHPT